MIVGLGRFIFPYQKRPSIGMCHVFFIVSDFLGRLRPSTTTTRKTRGTLGVAESSSPRKALHVYSSNSSRGNFSHNAANSYGKTTTYQRTLFPHPVVIINWVHYLGPPGLSTS